MTFNSSSNVPQDQNDAIPFNRKRTHNLPLPATGANATLTEKDASVYNFNNGSCLAVISNHSK